MDTSVREKLIAMADSAYLEFTLGLNPDTGTMLGVRIPQLRILARQIARSNWQEYLETTQDQYFEEVMLRGMIIGYARIPEQERLELITGFVPVIPGWGICDTFCSTLASAKQHRSLYWDFLQPYLSSHNEFELRFAVVMLLSHFITGEYIDRILAILDGIKHDGYYVQMAVAWAVSFCFIKFPEKTLPFLTHNTLDDFTFSRSIQKIVDSYRVDNQAKDMVRSLRRASAGKRTSLL